MKVGIIGYGSMGKMLLEKLSLEKDLIDDKLYLANRSHEKIVKVIPSVMAEINKSQTLICFNELVNARDKGHIFQLLEGMGTVIELPELEMGMGSELVSCMPGFIAAIFNEICLSAQKHTNITPEEVVQMVLNTMIGTGQLMLENNYSYQDVISRVATKGRLL